MKRHQKGMTTAQGLSRLLIFYALVHPPPPSRLSPSMHLSTLLHHALGHAPENHIEEPYNDAAVPLASRQRGTYINTVTIS